MLYSVITCYYHCSLGDQNVLTAVIIFLKQLDKRSMQYLSLGIWVMERSVSFLSLPLKASLSLPHSSSRRNQSTHIHERHDKARIVLTLRLQLESRKRYQVRVQVSAATQEQNQVLCTEKKGIEAMRCQWQQWWLSSGRDCLQRPGVSAKFIGLGCLSEKLFICRGIVVTKWLCMALPACISRVYVAWNMEKNLLSWKFISLYCLDYQSI